MSVAMGSRNLEGGNPLANSNFSTPRVFNFITNPPNKTIDIGRSGLSLSLDAQGRVLQASTYHPDHGIVLAAAFEQFNGEKFYDVAYVRTYRTRMLHMLEHNLPGFGLDFGVVDGRVSIEIPETSIAAYRIDLPNDVELSIETQVHDQGRFSQYAKVTNRSSTCVTFPYAFRANVSLNRASYGQLTEGGPIPLPRSHNILRKDHHNTVCIYNPNLNTRLLSRLNINETSYDCHNVSEQETFAAPINVIVEDTIRIPPGEVATLCASFQLLPHLKGSADVPKALISGSLDRTFDEVQSHWKFDKLVSTYVLRRNIQYILANCTVPTSQTTIAVITDHVALPLGWNRDNYWQIRLLLETRAKLDMIVNRQFVEFYEKAIRKVIRGHLEWVYLVAERPNGFWQRSYLVNGKPKDRTIFQLDQQCYPLLELCDFLDHFTEETTFARNVVNSGAIQEILSVLDSKRNAQTGLWPTDETPGDDAVGFPHHFSSHVLLWRTFTRLHRLFALLDVLQGPQSLHLDIVAVEIRARTIESFSATRLECGNLMFAYLTDGHGNYTFYHDANDVPTLFAKEWDFVSSPEETATWTNTMRFGLSPANERGYCSDGLYAGLGSVHSPGAWTLGYFQELAYAALGNDIPAIRVAWTKIVAAMHWDGTFSEAVSPETAKCTSKAWFSWPGAMIGTLLIEMRKNGQERHLLGATVE